jgi:hypothetical protein
MMVALAEAPGYLRAVDQGDRHSGVSLNALTQPHFSDRICALGTWR